MTHICCEVWDSGQVFTRAHGVSKHRTHTRFDLHVHSGDLQRHDDVGEEDSRVHAVPTHRLQGDLGGEIGHEAGVEHRDSFARFPVLRKRPASLPHKPHGSTTDRLRQCSTSKGHHALHLFRLDRPIATRSLCNMPSLTRPPRGSFTPLPTKRTLETWSLQSPLLQSRLRKPQTCCAHFANPGPHHTSAWKRSLLPAV